MANINQFNDKEREGLSLNNNYELKRGFSEKIINKKKQDIDDNTNESINMKESKSEKKISVRSRYNIYHPYSSKQVSDVFNARLHKDKKIKLNEN